jgi:hypothetical protein
MPKQTCSWRSTQIVYRCLCRFPCKPEPELPLTPLRSPSVRQWALWSSGSGAEVREIQAHRSSFAFSADLTTRFQIGLPALAAPLADLCSSLVAIKSLPRIISNTNLFSARLTTSRAMASSSIFTLFTVTRSVCSLVVSKFSCLSALSQEWRRSRSHQITRSSITAKKPGVIT